MSQQAELHLRSLNNYNRSDDFKGPEWVIPSNIKLKKTGMFYKTYKNPFNNEQKEAYKILWINAFVEFLKKKAHDIIQFIDKENPILYVPETTYETTDCIGGMWDRGSYWCDNEVTRTHTKPEKWYLIFSITQEFYGCAYTTKEDLLKYLNDYVNETDLFINVTNNIKTVNPFQLQCNFGHRPSIIFDTLNLTIIQEQSIFLNIFRDLLINEYKIDINNKEYLDKIKKETIINKEKTQQKQQLTEQCKSIQQKKETLVQDYQELVTTFVTIQDEQEARYNKILEMHKQSPEEVAKLNAEYNKKCLQQNGGRRRRRGKTAKRKQSRKQTIRRHKRRNK
jgi:hypothetical protein